MLDPVHQDFFAGGAGEERTVRYNIEAYERRRTTIKERWRLMFQASSWRLVSGDESARWLLSSNF